MNPFIALLFTMLFAAPAWAQPRPAPAEQRAAPKADPRAMLRALEDAFAAVADRATPAGGAAGTAAQKKAGPPSGGGPGGVKAVLPEGGFQRQFFPALPPEPRAPRPR